MRRELRRRFCKLRATPAWSIHFRAMIWVITGGEIGPDRLPYRVRHDRHQTASRAAAARSARTGAGAKTVRDGALDRSPPDARRGCRHCSGHGRLSHSRRCTLYSQHLFLLLTEEKSGSLLSYAALAIGVLLVPGIFVWVGAGELVAGMPFMSLWFRLSGWGASLPRFCSRSCWSSAVFGSQIAWPAGSWRHVASWVS